MPVAERDVLASLPLQLVEILDTPLDEDPAIARLFPDAYSAAEHAEHAAEFRRYMEDDLRDRHRLALETLATGARSERIDHDELYAWMTALTQLRLVLGTRIGISEHTEPEDSPAGNLYGYLSWLQEQVVAALSQP